MKVVCLLLLALAVANGMMSSRDVESASMKQKFAEVTTKIASTKLMEPLAIKEFNPQAQISTACLNAVDTLLQAVVNCSYTITQFSTTQAVSTFCSGSCPSDFDNAVTGVIAACNNQNDRQVFDASYGSVADSLQRATLAVKTVCLKDSNTGAYCFPEFYQMYSSASYASDPAYFTQSILDTICTTCTVEMLGLMHQYGDNSTLVEIAYLQLLCLKDPTDGAYCMPKVESAITALQSSTNMQGYDVICTPCFRMYMTVDLEIAAAYGTGSTAAGVSSLIRAYCTPDNIGRPCIDRIESVAGALGQQQTNPCGNITGATTCPGGITGSCASFIGQLEGGLGCCLPTIFQALYSATGGTGGDFSSYAELEGFFSSCGHPIGAPCSGYIVNITIVIDNLLYSYYSAHRNEIDPLIESDLGVHFSVDSSKISAGNAQDGLPTTMIGAGIAAKVMKYFKPQADSGTVTATYIIVPDTYQQATQIQGSVGGTNTAPIPLPSTSQTPLLARADPSKPLVVATSQSAATVQRSAAYNVAPMAFVVLLCLVLAVLF